MHFQTDPFHHWKIRSKVYSATPDPALTFVFSSAAFTFDSLMVLKAEARESNFHLVLKLDIHSCQKMTVTMISESMLVPHGLSWLCTSPASPGKRTLLTQTVGCPSAKVNLMPEFQDSSVKTSKVVAGGEGGREKAERESQEGQTLQNP